MRGKMIQIEDLEPSWVVFKYERLPIFCYRCGILGHQDKECPQLKTGCFSSDDDVFNLVHGSVLWLRRVAKKKISRNSQLDTHEMKMRMIFS